MARARNGPHIHHFRHAMGLNKLDELLDPARGMANRQDNG